MTKNPLGAVRRALAFLLVLTIALPALAAEPEAVPPLEAEPAPYQDVVQVEQPEALDVLVNKYYQLPQDYKPELKALPSAYGGWVHLLRGGL